MLAGSQLVVVTAEDDALVLRPPPPANAVADVGAAVRDALRFPLAGEPLEALVSRGTRATILVEPPNVPLPGTERDPRQAAIAAAVAELERLGVPTGYQTLLVAGGLARRAGHEQLETLVSPDFARRFHGHVEVHDVESEDLVELGTAGPLPLRVHPGTRQYRPRRGRHCRGDRAARRASCARRRRRDLRSLRAAGAYSLLETSASQGWRLGLELERALLRRVPVIGASLVLNHPRLGGTLGGYPYETQALERIVRSPFRQLFRLLPGGLRAYVLRSLPLERTAAAAYGGPPSVAHSEALLRGVELRGITLDRPLDAVCIGVPRTTPYLPRERPNPLLGSYLGLGLALRLWRDSFPVAEGGTAILMHRFQRHFTHPTQQPYRAFFAATRGAGQPDASSLLEAEQSAGSEARALQLYRSGRTCHPLLPFSDWDGCRPAISRLDHVLIAGCRDHAAARQLGFVPTHGIAPALTMVQGWSDRPPRVGFLLSPPYFPLRVTS